MHDKPEPVDMPRRHVFGDHDPETKQSFPPPKVTETTANDVKQTANQVLTDARTLLAGLDQQLADGRVLTADDVRAHLAEIDAKLTIVGNVLTLIERA